MIKKIVFLEVRSKSLRLPYKCLLPVGGLETVLLLLNRIKSKKYQTIVVTTKDESDDYLCKLLKKKNFSFYRGSVNDVYRRYIDCAKNLKLNSKDIIVRTTGDNLFLNEKFILQIINEFNKTNKKFLQIDRMNSKLPYGMGAEVFTFNLIKLLKPTYKNDPEHVTLQIKRNKKLCHSAIIKSPKNLYNERCTLDTIDDYIKIFNIFKGIKNPATVSWEVLCKKLLNKKINKKKINLDNAKNIILGTAQLGFQYGINNKTDINQKEVNKILLFLNKIGVNKIDTSRNYLSSEKRIAKAIKLHKLDYYIFTKISSKKSFEDIKKQFVISKKILKKIDCILLHDPKNYFEYKKELDRFLRLMIKKKIIDKVGISLNFPDELIRLINNKIFSFYQIPLNILDKRWNLFLNKFTSSKLIIRSIFLQGIFFTNKRNIPKKLLPTVQSVTKKLKILVKRFERYDVRDLMLSYVLSNNNLNKIIIGIDDENQAKELLFYLTRKKLLKKEIKLVDDFFNNIKLQILSPALWYKS